MIAIVSHEQLDRQARGAPEDLARRAGSHGPKAFQAMLHLAELQSAEHHKAENQRAEPSGAGISVVEMGHGDLHPDEAHGRGLSST
jgi:hypothetical protein